MTPEQMKTAHGYHGWLSMRIGMAEAAARKSYTRNNELRREWRDLRRQLNAAITRAANKEAEVLRAREAADDLLAALEWAVSQQPLDDSCDTWASDARAAIAKARR